MPSFFAAAFFSLGASSFLAGSFFSALAAIELAPENTAVLYGMPGEGVVVVWADARAKARVRDLLARMV